MTTAQPTRIIDLGEIVCQRTQVSDSEGWGGGPIEAFPPFRFFLAYHRGEHAKAERDFSEWYYERFVDKKYALLPKAYGGMVNGPIFNELTRIDPAAMAALSRGRLHELDPEVVWMAIRICVHQRFKLYISISKEGFIPDRGDCVLATITAGRLELQRGHHRVSILKVLGYRSAPMILIPVTIHALQRRLVMGAIPAE